MSDQELIRRIENKDEEALRALYEQYNRLVFSLALHICGDPAEAEEITLDVFIRVWRKASSYQPEKAQVSTWLTSIARYRAIDSVRRRNARPPEHDFHFDDARYVEGSRDTAVSRRPEAATARRQRRQRVRQAVAELPPEQRQVLALAYFGGHSHSEIAAMLELPLGTVKTRLRLAMKKLRFDLRREAVDR